MTQPLATAQRTCTRCHETKDLSQFDVINARTLKMSSWCKSCKADWHREKASDPHSARKERLAASRLTSKANALAFIREALKGKSCACGQADPNELRFHRLDGGKTIQFMVDSGYGVKTIEAAMKDAVVECWSCYERRANLSRARAKKAKAG